MVAKTLNKFLYKVLEKLLFFNNKNIHISLIIKQKNEFQNKGNIY
jgi:hypothetical protein